MSYIPKHFITEELVDPITFKELGKRALEVCFDERILIQIDLIREYFNVPVTVNNWKTGGDFKDRGFRRSESYTGSQYSQHRFGRAIDFDVKDLTADVVRKEIIKNQNSYYFKYITRMEENVNWVHIDCMNSNYKGIYLFKV